MSLNIYKHNFNEPLEAKDIQVTGRLTSNEISAGIVSATVFYGDGSRLTGVSAASGGSSGITTSKSIAFSMLFGS